MASTLRPTLSEKARILQIYHMEMSKILTPSFQRITKLFLRKKRTKNEQKKIIRLAKKKLEETYDQH